MCRQASWSILMSVLASVAAASEDPAASRPTVALQPAKARYVSGEPIGIVVTVSNPKALPAVFEFVYPESFRPEFAMTVRFDGGRSASPLPPRAGAYSILGGPGAHTTVVPPKGRWSAPVFLQNHLTQPPPGEHVIRYHAELSYLLGEPPDGDDVWKTAKTISADGELRFSVTPPDPVALEAVLAGYDAKFHARPGLVEVVEALRAVGDPAVVPHLASALDAVETIRPTPHAPSPGPIFEMLERFRDREDAQRVVTGHLFSENGAIASYALEWLRWGSVALEPATVDRLIDREISRWRSPHDVLLYLYQVPIAPGPSGRERLRGALPKIKQPAELARALVVLSRWGVPRDAAIREALDAMVGRYDFRLGGPDRSTIIEALGAWHVPLDVGTLRTLLRSTGGMAVPTARSVLPYLRSFPRGTYRDLTPEVVAVLKWVIDDVVIEALSTLDHWGYNLTRGEFEALSNRGGAVGAATRAYVERHPVR